MSNYKKYNRRDALKSFLGISVLPFLPLKAFSFIEDCVTTDDVLGPFYIKQAPELNNIAPLLNNTQRLFITGTIYERDCITPISGALIEVWQADSEGFYQEDNYRGVTYSDENGNYNFESIMPGKYLNGNLYRPSHIHFKVSYQNNPALITQLYFQGDTSIDSDPLASIEDAQERIISLDVDNQNNLNGVFNIYLNIGQNSVELTNYNNNDLKSSIKSIYPTPITSFYKVEFFNHKVSRTKLELIDLNGKTIRILMDEKINKGLIKKQFQKDNLESGIYIIRQIQDQIAIDSKRITII